jgi:hypothetical protein
MRPIARVLALAYAARASEATGELKSALPYYRDALAAWTPDIGDSIALDAPRPPSAPSPQIEDMALATRPALVSRDEVAGRAGDLSRSLGIAGGPDLERGRWLLRQAQPRQAVAVLEQVVRRYPRTTAGAEATAILPRARLEAAVALADTTNPSANLDAALKELDVLSGEPLVSTQGEPIESTQGRPFDSAQGRPFDASRGIAGVVGATIRLLQGRTEAADAQMTASLQRWVREGTTNATRARGGHPRARRD